LARGGPDRRSLDALKSYADIRAAQQLQEDRRTTRLLVQARLLARQTSAAIALLTGVPVPVVDTYEMLFFNVRGHLHAPHWIHLHAIGPKWRPGTAIPDAGAVLKSFAFHGGPLVLNAVLPYLIGGKDLFEPPLDLTTEQGRKEQAVRLAAAAELLPRGVGTD